MLEEIGASHISLHNFFGRHKANAENIAKLEVSAPRSSYEKPEEQAALARAAMGDLTELTRLVFHLRVQEDLSFREIAELAGTTEQSARWHMHQARTKLLARLAGEPGTGD